MIKEDALQYCRATIRGSRRMTPGRPGRSWRAATFNRAETKKKIKDSCK
jgi:hypothetical protein